VSKHRSIDSGLKVMKYLLLKTLFIKMFRHNKSKRNRDSNVVSPQKWIKKIDFV